MNQRYIIKFNKTYTEVLLLITMILCIPACDLFLEDDIENELVYLNTPRDGMVSENPVVDFWWDPVSGAEKYNLQVATPSFDWTAINKLVLDTNISANKFTFELYPDTFTWRVQAYNGVSQTAWFEAAFRIDSTDGVYDVVLTSPLPDAATNQTSVTFEWQSQPNAVYYTFRLSLEQSVLINQNFQNTKLILPNEVDQLDELAEGNYTWEVRAEAENGQVSEYTGRSIIIDRTTPETPSLRSPSNFATVTSDQVLFEWNRKDDNGSAISDSLIISGSPDFDAEFTDYVIASENSYDYSLDSTGTYYWYVRSYDAAGNIGKSSSIREFTYSNVE